jgi:hypothetical protein
LVRPRRCSLSAACASVRPLDPGAGAAMELAG